MSTETFQNSGICKCAYCKEDIDLNDKDTLTMSLSKFVGIEQDPYDAMECEQKIVTQGYVTCIIFHRKCLVAFFKDTPISITESIINYIGVSYPLPSHRSEQMKMLIKRGKLK